MSEADLPESSVATAREAVPVRQTRGGSGLSVFALLLALLACATAGWGIWQQQQQAASSTTRFNWISPQRPRTCGVPRALTRLPVSASSHSEMLRLCGSL